MKSYSTKGDCKLVFMSLQAGTCSCPSNSQKPSAAGCLAVVLAVEMAVDSTLTSYYAVVFFCWLCRCYVPWYPWYVRKNLGSLFRTTDDEQYNSFIFLFRDHIPAVYNLPNPSLCPYTNINKL